MENKTKNPAAVALGRLSRRRMDIYYLTVAETKLRAKAAKKTHGSGLRAAAELGISPARFSQYLNGRRRAPISLLSLNPEEALNSNASN